MTVTTAAPGARSNVVSAIHDLGKAPTIGVGVPTTYAKGAQVPTDTSAVAAPVIRYHSAKGIPCLIEVANAHVGYAGYDEWPYAHYIGQRKDDTPAVATAISNHLAARGPALHSGHIARVGYAGYPYAAHLIGKRDVNCEADIAIFITGKATVTSVDHLTTYANGAVVPTDNPSAAASKRTLILPGRHCSHVEYTRYSGLSYVHDI